tara:strand:- start:2445 stop:3152 length:708 start_codon:yes stop_codon:yes gene_type:complete
MSRTSRLSQNNNNRLVYEAAKQTKERQPLHELQNNNWENDLFSDLLYEAVTTRQNIDAEQSTIDRITAPPTETTVSLFMNTVRHLQDLNYLISIVKTNNIDYHKNNLRFINYEPGRENEQYQILSTLINKALKENIIKSIPSIPDPIPKLQLEPLSPIISRTTPRLSTRSLRDSISRSMSRLLTPRNSRSRPTNLLGSGGKLRKSKTYRKRKSKKYRKRKSKTYRKRKSKTYRKY